MKFIEKFTLSVRGPIDQLADESVQGTLLVGEESICEFDSDHDQYGCNTVNVFPSYHNGNKAWLIEEVWSSAPGYSCSGLTSEYIISFEDGVKKLIELGAYGGLFC